MADDHSGGIKLYAESESNDAHVEEKKKVLSSVSYNHQLTPSSSVEEPMAVDVAMPPEKEDMQVSEGAAALQKSYTMSSGGDAVPPLLMASQAEAETTKELCEVSSFGFDRTANASSVKRTRGRPRKDCQRAPKHHLGQSAATKVFPGRPRFRGRKHLQHYFMTHPNHKLQDLQSALDVYEDIDADLKSSCEISDKILMSSDVIPDNELKIEKYCALCNLSEKSLLGQGKLKHFKPSEGFSCFEVMEQKAKEKTMEVATSETGSELKLFFKKQKLLNSPGEQIKIHRSKSFQSFGEKPSMLTDLIQELEVTGFKSVPESSNIFEQSGELYAHFNCAAWSDGVTKTFEKLLSNVDKAVVTAAFQKCSKCSRYGASVRCCVSECTKIYHYPCAIVSGALQNANCFKIICSIHLEDAFSFGVICMACHESGDLSQLLLCTSCSNYYHGNCMDPPIVPSPDVRAGWQCLDCKVCQNCRQPGDSTKMIICNTCDKGYHTFCVKPAISSIPKSGWKCSGCRMCGDCGARTPGNGPSSRWHMNYSLCDSCYQQRNKGIACPLCGKAYRQFSQRKGMKHCTICQKYIHEECDKRNRRNSIDYVCPLCSATETKSIEGGVDHHIKDNFLSVSSSRESFLSGNDESLSSDSEDAFDGVHSKISGRRTSSGELRHKKSSKPKYKAFSIPNFMYSMATAVSQKEYKMDDDDPTEDNKLILASATDEFVLCQDLCVMCGSFGRGEEGRLLVCAQCGQCYHSYCVSVKVTTVVLKKGWRCLDCTVCEGCGQPHDEGRLLLCDECDISFHIYCLDPPLQEVPQGNWKCKWCVNCVKCGSKSPGVNCNWQVNYTLCGPCASFTVCCLCQQRYEENELVIQCSKCERWLHGMCDQIENEDHAEKCAEYGYNCPHCRPPDELPPHLLPPPRTPTPEIEPVPEKNPSPVRPKEPEAPPPKVKHPVQFFLDGVCLSESGMQYIKSLAPEQPKKIPRPRKLKQGLADGSKPSFSLHTFDRNEDSTSAGVPEETKNESISAEDALKAYDFEEGRLVIDSKEAEDKKKRPRKLQKLGIGGFSVKPRGRVSTGKEALAEPETSTSQGPEGPAPPPPSSAPSSSSSTAVEVTTATPNDASELNGGDKPKRKRKPKRKTHLDESFPSYLREERDQVTFRNSMAQHLPSSWLQMQDAFFGKDLLLSCKKLGKSSADVPETGPDSSTATKTSEDGSKGNADTGTAMDTKSAIRVQEDVKDFMPSSGPAKGKDVNMTYKSMIKSEIESIKEEHLSSTSSIASVDVSGLPQIDSKEVEDVFKGVLQEKRNAVQYLFPSGSSGAPPKVSTPFIASPGAAQGLNTHTSLHPNVLQNLHHPDSNSSWPDSDCDQSQMQKSLLKWESDEQLGLLSTISPVLYANINLPHLKIEFPAWADRVKQIAKIWRGLPTEKRQPYLQRARENRAASRTQRSNSVDSDKSQKESRADNEQEKQWKQLQAMRQLQHQNQQRLLQEQRAQAVLKSQAEKPVIPPSVSEVDKNLKLYHSKSLSEIPQFTNVSIMDENLGAGKDGRKMFEKRWSSSALDLNAAQALMQSGKVKMEVHTPVAPPPFRKECIQNTLISGRGTLVHTPRLQTQLPIPPDVAAAASARNTIKSTDSFQVSPSPAIVSPQNVNQKPQPPMPPANPVLMSKDEVARVTTPNIPKEIMNTPPATPRPHSSDSFFQISASPQSQLLASLDSHSQPSPATTAKVMGTTSSSILMEPSKIAPQPIGGHRPAELNLASKVPQQLPPPLSSPKPQPQPPQLTHSVEQFVLQQSPLTSANIVKQLSQYKETFGSITGTHPARTMLAPPQEKPIEQQNLEQFLQDGQLTMSYPNKVPQHQQLRDLLQNKKFCDSGMDGGDNGKLNSQASQNLAKMCTVSTATRTGVDNTVHTAVSSFPSSLATSQSNPDEQQMSIDQNRSQQAPSRNAFLLSENDKKNSSPLDSVCLPMVSPRNDPKEEEPCAEQLNKKRKTTAAELMKDLESQSEEHDVMTAGCNLDVLPGDVGELELDDDELLGLGNDFNILEYADPELDKSLVGEGDKNNILDEHLDLDDKDEELEDDVIKESESGQEKDLISQELTSDEKRELEAESEKCKNTPDADKDAGLPDNFLHFDKKSVETNVAAFESSFEPKGLEPCVENPPVNHMSTTVKEEPKQQVFSSCSLSSQTYSPNIDIKLEKTTSENCSIQKTHHPLSFGTENSPQIQVQEQIAPPSYRMVTALKQAVGQSHPPNSLVQQHAKSIFPLHINMNMRQDLPQPSVISSTVMEAKPLLLQEQPLLLAELVEQEKREQRRQTQEGMISPHGDALLSDIDFERLKDDVFSGPPDDSLGGPGSLLGSHDPGLQAAVSPSINIPPPSPNSHNFGPPPYSLLWQNQEPPRALASRPVAGFMQNLKKTSVSAVIGSLGLQGTPLAQKAQALSGNIVPRHFNPNFVPTPPSPPVDPHIDPEKLKLMNYEKQLLQQQAALSTQQKYFETEVIRLRKMKKALNAKQRQLRKNGSELTENDSVELARVSQEQAGLQKQLDQVRKQTRQTTIALQDYRLKQQKRQQQQQPQPVPRSPIHPSVNSVQSSPQNSQSPLQFAHAAPPSPMMPASPVGPSAPVRLQHSPSPLVPSSIPSSVTHQASLQSALFSTQIPLQLQMAKAAENKSWPTPPPLKIPQGDLQPPDRTPKREQFDRNVNPPQAAFSLNTASHNDITLKGLMEVKKRLSEDSCPSDSNSSVLAAENLEQQNLSAKLPCPENASQNLLMKEQKIDSVSTAQSPVPQSILSQSLPSSVSNTLKFTLRQTGMPTVCLPPTDSAAENASELGYTGSADVPAKPNEAKPATKQESVKQENSTENEASGKNASWESNKSAIKEEVGTIKDENLQKNSDQAQETKVESKAESESFGGKKVSDDRTTESGEQLLVHIKQEVMDDVPPESTTGSSDKREMIVKDKSNQRQKDEDMEGSSDEELENLTKTATTSETEQGEQNVLLKQLLQNCPSAETPRKSDTFIGLRKEESDDLNKLELPFDVGDMQSKSKLMDPKSKKPSYLDIRRAQLEKEPTPPPGEKPKAVKRKRPKKKKLEQPGKPEGGVLAKKKCRRASSKVEEGYETYAETLMNKLTSLPPLRILEPNIKPNYSAIPVFGAGDLNVRESQLKGPYLSMTIPDQVDVYSFQPYTDEQPPSSTLLPPSSPPYRGFYNQEFPAIAKAFEKNELSLALKPTLENEPARICRDAGSPDTVISSSSPECCLTEPQGMWPRLIFVDKVLPEGKRNGSPVIPLMYPIPVKLYPKEWSELDEDKDKENIPDDRSEIGLTKTKMSGIGGYSAPLKDSGNVAVTLTLSSAAAEDICGVLSALADLLKIPIPASYEIVERTATPPSQKLGLYRRSKNSEVSIHSLLNGKPRFCRHCDIVVLSAGIRKKAADLTCISKEEQEDDEVIFCSTNCYMQFALTHQSSAMLEEKEAAAVVDHIGETTFDKNLKFTSAEDLLSLDDKESSMQIGNEGLRSEEMLGDNILDSFGMQADEKYLSSDMDLLNDKMEICEEEPVIRKWRSIKYKYWHSEGDMPKKRKDDEKSARPFYHTIKPSQMPKDERKCIFCHITGDGDTNGAARLLNMDVNKWVHLNCALWSYEVYETVNGALMNVEVAFKRSRHLNCYSCHKQGASVRCFKTRCPNVYHFPCARREQCAFYKDKTVLCPQHIHKGNPDNRLDSVAVFRRVYINREEHKQVASMIQDDKYVMRVGSLIFLNIGQLLPTQIQAFHNTNCIYPVGYKVIRMYWSMRKLGRRSQYICTINEVSGKPEFTIQVKDSDQKDIILKDKTAKGVWQKVLYPIEKMRKQAKTIKIFPDFITGDDLFGLSEPAVLRIVESLPGVDTLFDYNFRYGRSPFLELPLAINPTGCARSEPKLRTHFKRSHAAHISNTTRSFHSAFASIYHLPEVSSPYVKQFVHSKSSQYRKMKTEWRNNVYLARSRIQGLGLYAARDMEKHTMVIEYIGQLIRNEIAEKNEAIYDAQNRGIYMFRLDENRVIDATLSGGLARYINHSCNPNCVAEVVQIDRENKILIITNRRVTRGEELAYDYKFEVEDDQHKIPCMCGAHNCRKWMN